MPSGSGHGCLRAMGPDIGSGRVESACKHVVGSRLKRSGMRGSRAGCQAVLSLRTTWLNGQWKTFWARHRWPARRQLPTVRTHTARHRRMYQELAGHGLLL